MADPISTHEETIWVAAPPEAVFDLITAMERYGEWSTENKGGRWESGSGEVGDVFLGLNEGPNGQWERAATIVEREPGRRFAFVTGPVERPNTLWRYVLEPEGDGTRVTERHEMQSISPLLEAQGPEGLAARIAITPGSMQATLKGMKATAEGS